MNDPDTSTRKHLAYMLVGGFTSIVVIVILAMFCPRVPNTTIMALVGTLIGLFAKDVGAALSYYFHRSPDADDDTPPDSTRSTTSTVTSSTTSNPTPGVPTK